MNINWDWSGDFAPAPENGECDGATRVPPAELIGSVRFDYNRIIPGETDNVPYGAVYGMRWHDMTCYNIHVGNI